MPIKTFKDGAYEVIESIPGETILQFLSRVFGIAYDKTMQEIDNGTVAKANKASNAKINKGFHRNIKYMTESSEISKDDYDKFDRDYIMKNIEKDFISQNKKIPAMDDYYPDRFLENTICELPEPIKIGKIDYEGLRNAEMRFIDERPVRRIAPWIILIPKSFYAGNSSFDKIYPISFSTREEARIILKALKIWNPERYRKARIERCY